MFRLNGEVPVAENPDTASSIRHVDTYALLKILTTWLIVTTCPKFRSNHKRTCSA